MFTYISHELIGSHFESFAKFAVKSIFGIITAYIFDVTTLCFDDHNTENIMDAKCSGSAL